MREKYIHIQYVPRTVVFQSIEGSLTRLQRLGFVEKIECTVVFQSVEGRVLLRLQRLGFVEKID